MMGGVKPYRLSPWHLSLIMFSVVRQAGNQRIFRYFINRQVVALRGLPFSPDLKGEELAKTNYSYEKRQRDLAKKKKQEEKKQRKLVKGPDQPDDAQEGAAEPVAE